MPDSCPAVEDRLRLRSDPERREIFLSHAAACPDCFLWMTMVEEGMEQGAAVRWKSLRRPLAAAVAAVVLVAIGTIVLFRFPRNGFQGPAISYTLPLGAPVSAGSGEHAAGPDEEKLLALPGGTRLRLEPGTRIAFVAQRAGERARIALASGALEAEVAPGRGAFRIESTAGEVEVLGTHLRAKTFAWAGSPCLCAEVYDGKIRVGNGSGELIVSTGERAVLAGEGIPLKQQIGGTWESPLRTFAGLLKEDSGRFVIPAERFEQARTLAAFLIGGRWERPLDFGDALDDLPELREARRFLREKLDEAR